MYMHTHSPSPLVVALLRDHQSSEVYGLKPENCECLIRALLFETMAPIKAPNRRHPLLPLNMSVQGMNCKDNKSAVAGA